MATPSARLPTGTVTFLFTDIEGSTRRWEAERTAMEAALQRHNAILDRAIAAHNGQVFKTMGDAYCAAFAQAGDAVAAAIDAQRALHLERWDEIPTTTGAGPAPGFEPLRVRMGLHTGLVELKDGDYFGRPVNRVARLMAAAHGGQVLVSLATQQLVRDALPKGCELVDLGVHRLKDLEHTEHLFRLVAPGLPDVATPPVSAERLPDRGGPGVLGGPAAALDPDTLHSACPYRGLFAFREEDAPFFFGREAFTELLVEAVQTTRLVGVIGPSGSGKSSVVFAGLVPRLQGDGGAWTVLDFRPGPQPFHALAAMLVPLLERTMSETDRLIEVEKLAGALSSGTLSLAKVLARLQQRTGDSGRILLVADQFEELYTLCPDVDERHRFLDCLFEGLMDPAARGVPQMTLVLTLRADFMGHALAYRPFADALQHHNVVLGPMTKDELTAAIVRPAEKQGRQFESGLPERLLADLGEHPGNLPLLEFALTQLWEHQQNGWLTHEAYDTIGHVEGALARYADEVYGRLPAADQATAERIFLQLVRPGEGTEDTRRLATHTELGEPDWELVSRLADARLVVTDRDAGGVETAEVVHEALIRSWRRLRGWMEANRAFRTWQERLRFSLKQWEASGRDDGALLRGAPLAEAEGWLKERGEALGEGERAFVAAGMELRDHEAAEREAQRRRERRLSWAVAAAAGIGLTVALVFAQRAKLEAQLALARQVAAGAEASLEVDPERSILLSLEALDISHEAGVDALPEAVSMAHRGLLGSFVERTLTGHTLWVQEVVFSPTGRLIASSSSDGTVRIWDANIGALEQQLYKPFAMDLETEARLRSLMFSPDGKRLAAARRDSTATIWDLESGRVEWLLCGHRKALNSIAYSPNGEILATGGDDDFIKLWRATDGVEVGTLGPLPPLSGYGKLAFSADGRRLAATSQFSSTLTIFELATGRIERQLAGGSEGFGGLAFSPDGTLLATAGLNGSAVLWDVSTGRRHMSLPASKTALTDVAFSPDGMTLATASTDQSIRLWDLRSEGKPALALLGHPNVVTSVTFSPDGTRLASGSGDLSARIWNLATTAEHLTLQTEPSLALDYSPDGRRLALYAGNDQVSVRDALRGAALVTIPARSGYIFRANFNAEGNALLTVGEDGSARIWNASSGEQQLMITATEGEVLNDARFSRDGRLVATAYDGTTGKVKLWSATDGRLVQTLEVPGEWSYCVAFSPDAKQVVACSQSGVLYVFDVESGDQVRTLRGHTSNNLFVEFSPDGKLLASSGDDNTVRLWDMASGASLGVLNVDGTPNTQRFSADGTLLAVAAGSLQVWRLANWTKVLDLPASGNAFVSVAFSPDGNRLATLGNNGKLQVLALDLDELMAIASKRLTRTLTTGECRQYLHVEVCPPGN